MVSTFSEQNLPSTFRVSLFTCTTCGTWIIDTRLINIIEHSYITSFKISNMSGAKKQKVELEELMVQEKVQRIELAQSGRAKCKECKQLIGKGYLRVGTEGNDSREARATPESFRLGPR